MGIAGIGAPCRGVQGREVPRAGVYTAGRCTVQVYVRQTGVLAVRCNQKSPYVSYHSNNCENERHFLL